MGHLVNPISFRLKYTRYWKYTNVSSTVSKFDSTNFYLERMFITYVETLLIRASLKSELGFGDIKVFNTMNKILICVYVYSKYFKHEYKHQFSVTNFKQLNSHTNFFFENKELKNFMSFFSFKEIINKYFRRNTQLSKAKICDILTFKIIFVKYYCLYFLFQSLSQKKFLFRFKNFQTSKKKSNKNITYILNQVKNHNLISSLKFFYDRIHFFTALKKKNLYLNVKGKKHAFPHSIEGNVYKYYKNQILYTIPTNKQMFDLGYSDTNKHMIMQFREIMRKDRLFSKLYRKDLTQYLRQYFKDNKKKTKNTRYFFYYLQSKMIFFSNATKNVLKLTNNHLLVKYNLKILKKYMTFFPMVYFKVFIDYVNAFLKQIKEVKNQKLKSRFLYRFFMKLLRKVYSSRFFYFLNKSRSKRRKGTMILDIFLSNLYKRFKTNLRPKKFLLKPTKYNFMKKRLYLLSGTLKRYIKRNRRNQYFLNNPVFKAHSVRNVYLEKLCYKKVFDSLVLFENK
jgi:hypothetical protein